jgi:hypothetical protein
MRKIRVASASSEVLVATFAKRSLARAMPFDMLHVRVQRTRSIRRIYPLA